MKKSKSTAPTVSREPRSGKSLKSSFSPLPLLVFLGGAVALIWLISSSFRTPAPTVTQTSPAATHSNSNPAPVAADRTEPAETGPLPEATRQRLLGTWQRTDAEYAIEIRLIAPDGVTDARYFNPFTQRSIHVAKATVTEAAGQPEFFMELRDTGYPGSTYTLTYDPGSDRLTGVYFQAAMQQNYEVVFERRREN